MKQDILCKGCELKTRKLFHNFHAPGEYMDFACGHARREYICDHCGHSIRKGDDCTCWSVWTDRNPLIPDWQEQYISRGPYEV